MFMCEDVTGLALCSSLTAERVQFRVRSTHLYRTERNSLQTQFASEICCSLLASEPNWLRVIK